MIGRLKAEQVVFMGVFIAAFGTASIAVQQHPTAKSYTLPQVKAAHTQVKKLKPANSAPKITNQTSQYAASTPTVTAGNKSAKKVTTSKATTNPEIEVVKTNTAQQHDDWITKPPVGPTSAPVRL